MAFASAGVDKLVAILVASVPVIVFLLVIDKNHIIQDLLLARHLALTNFKLLLSEDASLFAFITWVITTKVVTIDELFGAKRFFLLEAVHAAIFTGLVVCVGILSSLELDVLGVVLTDDLALIFVCGMLLDHASLPTLIAWVIAS